MRPRKGDPLVIDVYAVQRPRLTRWVCWLGDRLGAPVVPKAGVEMLMDSLRRTHEDRTMLKHQVRRLGGDA